MSDTTQPGWFVRNGGRFASIGLGLAAVGATLAVLSGPLYQWKIVPLFPAFGVLGGGALLAVIGALLCLISILVAIRVHKGEFVSHSSAGLFGLVVGLIVFAVPGMMLRSGAPPIHDVTTDTENPPVFVDALPLREQAKAPNPSDYVREVKGMGGSGTLDVPALQKKAFPDIVSLSLPVPPAEAFDRALAAADKQHWTIVSAKAEDGRIEAFDKTAWFGFVDDVVVRIAADGDGSKIDVRSVSRLGFGDAGKNAKRIRAYLKVLGGRKGHGG